MPINALVSLTRAITRFTAASNAYYLPVFFFYFCVPIFTAVRILRVTYTRRKVSNFFLEERIDIIAVINEILSEIFLDIASEFYNPSSGK